MKVVVVAAGFLASLVLASNTYADPIYGTVDALVNAYNKDSSADCGALNLPKCEKALLESYLGGGNWPKLHQININAGAWVSVNDYDPDTNLVAFDLSKRALEGVGAFLIKIGGGGGNGNDLFLFKNDPSLAYALIDLNDIADRADKPVSSDTISHIAVVPEPSSLLLLGVGALAATAVRRRSRQGQVISRA